MLIRIEWIRTRKMNFALRKILKNFNFQFSLGNVLKCQKVKEVHQEEKREQTRENRIIDNKII